jgi:hypothetical protein
LEAVVALLLLQHLLLLLLSDKDDVCCWGSADAPSMAIVNLQGDAGYGRKHACLALPLHSLNLESCEGR